MFARKFPCTDGMPRYGDISWKRFGTIVVGRFPCTDGMTRCREISMQKVWSHYREISLPKVLSELRGDFLAAIAQLITAGWQRSQGNLLVKKMGLASLIM